MEKIIIICGPTGIGKTSFAIKLARRFNGEIVSADSMQIYRHMDIGTAKPDEEEQKLVAHHLIDFLDPGKNFDAAMYAKAADRVIKEISARGKTPLIAGGTGLYIKTLLHGLFRSESLKRRDVCIFIKSLKSVTQRVQKRSIPMILSGLSGRWSFF